MKAAKSVPTNFNSNLISMITSALVAVAVTVPVALAVVSNKVTPVASAHEASEAANLVSAQTDACAVPSTTSESATGESAAHVVGSPKNVFSTVAHHGHSGSSSSSISSTNTSTTQTTNMTDSSATNNDGLVNVTANNNDILNDANVLSNNDVDVDAVDDVTAPLNSDTDVVGSLTHLLSL